MLHTAEGEGEHHMARWINVITVWRDADANVPGGLNGKQRNVSVLEEETNRTSAVGLLKLGTA